MSKVSNRPRGAGALTRGGIANVISYYSPLLEPTLNKVPIVGNDVERRLNNAFDRRERHVEESRNSFLVSVGKYS